MSRSRSSQMVVAAGFMALITGVPVFQTALELRDGRRPGVVEVFLHAPTPANLRAYETRLNDASIVGRKLRPWTQFVQFVLLEDAGAKAVVGRDGWLFYRPGVEHLTARPPGQQTGEAVADPVTAIVTFRDDLRARGIRLIVVPVPNKASVYPEKLSPRAGTGPIVCPETGDLFVRLRAARVEVVDLFEAFRSAKMRSAASASGAVYLARDSHWSPSGIEIAAEIVAEHVGRPTDASSGTRRYEARLVSTTRTGDLLQMLEAPPIERLYVPEEVECRRVFERGTDRPYQNAPDAELLVLGDSFLGVFEQDEPGSAGLISQLARRLGQPLTAIVNDGGASTLVRQELYRRPQLLSNKRLVIWEFAERDLRWGTEGWQIVPLPPMAEPLSHRDSTPTQSNHNPMNGGEP